MINLKCAVVTGGNGFLGTYLIKCLLEQNYYVYNITHLKQQKNNQENYKELSVSTDSIQKEIIYRPDFLFHLAWSGVSGEKRFNLEVQLENIRYACEMVTLAYQLKVKKFIFASSIMEYECLSWFFNENEKQIFPYNNIYSIAKLSGHMLSKLYCNSYHIDFFPVIISNVYGAGEKSTRFINSMVRKMQTEDFIDLTECSQLYDFIYVTDAIEMIVQIAKKGTPYKNYYIGNQQQFPLKEYVLKMKEVLGYTGTLNFGAIPYLLEPLSYQEFNVNAFYEEFAYRPQVSFEEGILKVYEGENI